MSVKLELYKVFKEVAEAGNITAAASALFISSRSQSALAFIAAMMPNPPALLTAAASEASAIQAMPPWKMGY